MIWQISVAIIAAAFAVLVVFLVKTLQAAEKSLDKTTQTLQEIQKTVDELSYEVKQVVRQANSITEDVEHKMKQLDPVLESVKNVGDVLNEVTLAAKQVSSSLIGRVKKTAHKAKSTAGPEQGASEEHPIDRSMHTYGSAYDGPANSKPDPGWMKWVDIASGVWQKYRS
ncbi:DUF948 domain-containing protein [Paenibacillus woosongensis]|uniref:DUF948 domain-containing protein n=1 Tax=Paenibacillus woosongensis TaxID=307580 RepID=A0AA95IAN7_9BACL|nr:DUF948 domain-containing protein [Paenibacillus woosongensis]WHX48438.1 DUF948 domain-containing protein [Paenibacillus woosongensis]GIP60335.1 general stress protein [Paenibacillus woosongensis]